MRVAVLLSLAVLMLASGPAVAAPNAGLRTDLVTPTWVNVTSTVGTPPYQRASPAFACDTTDANAGTCLLTGGFSFPTGGGYHSDTWSLKNGKWTNLSAANPYGRSSDIGLAWDPTDHEFVELGATLANGAFVGTYATYNLTTGWSTATAVSFLASNPVSNVILAWDATLGKVVSIGGQFDVNVGSHDFTEPWTFGFVGGTWSNLTAAVGTTWGGFMDPWVAQNETLVAIFGGLSVVSGTAGTSQAATWTLGATWVAVHPTGGPPRGRALSEGVYVGSETGVLYGGFNYSAGSIAYVASDTWAYGFAGPTWTNLTAQAVPSPPALGSGAMAQNSTGLVYLVGGQTIGPTRDYNATWTFTLAASGGGIVTSGANPLEVIVALVIVGALMPPLVLLFATSRKESRR